MDYIELLEKYMQGLTTPEEEKALLDWLQHDGDARSTISAFYEKRWKETPDTGVSAELQYKMLMNIKQNICQHEIENQSTAGRKIVWMNVMKYAAAILATMVVSVFSAYYFYSSSNPQPIGFSGILLAKRQNSFYCTYFLHNRNVADTKSPYPIKRLEVIRWFNQKSMVFNQSLS